jgi:hypothetical protein
VSLGLMVKWEIDTDSGGGRFVTSCRAIVGASSFSIKLDSNKKIMFGILS